MEGNKTVNVPRLPLEIQFLILELTPFESHQTLSLVCKAWRNFILTSHSIRKNRYISYTIPKDHVGGPRTTFSSPLYHGVLSYLTHYVRMDDGDYYPCYLKSPSSKTWGETEQQPTKYLLYPRFFGNDLISLDQSDGEKGKGKLEPDALYLNFNNIYAHELVTPWKQHENWVPPFTPRLRASSEPPTVAEFFQKNGRAVNNRLAEYYNTYCHADVLKVVMKYKRDSAGTYFLEFALLPLPRGSGNVNSVSALDKVDFEGEKGRTRGLIRRWEVLRKLRGMVKRKPRDGKSRADNLRMGWHYEGSEVKSVWDADGIHVLS
ncbi:hypothetical protein TWF718_007754 [Orbilia javanica]|uniref:F-box domain-containing protein n=1 Tax=Orbilia javanica TaxID=47235 RepID=A0AAN8MVS5_9PEZI